MRITSTKGSATVATIEEAAAWLVEMQPSYAAVDGNDIYSPEDEWTADSATRAIAAALDDLEDMTDFNDYRIAFVLGGTGDWEIAEEFSATDNDAANAYAESNYAGREWYVLDSAGENINA